MLNRIILLLSLAATIVLLAMLHLTNPTEVGPLGVLVIFTAIYLVVFGIATSIIFLFRRTMGRNGMRRKDYYYAAVMAFGPIMALLMQSFGGMTLWTGSLVVAFVGLGCFLVNKRL